MCSVVVQFTSVAPTSRRRIILLATRISAPMCRRRHDSDCSGSSDSKESSGEPLAEARRKDELSMDLHKRSVIGAIPSGLEPRPISMQMYERNASMPSTSTLALAGPPGVSPPASGGSATRAHSNLDSDTSLNKRISSKAEIARYVIWTPLIHRHSSSVNF